MSSNKFSDYVDIYAEPVNFTYRNKNTFKTICGGLITHLIIFALFGYFLSLLSEMLKREIPIINNVPYISYIPERIDITGIDNNNYTNTNSRLWMTSIGLRLNGNLITIDEKYLKLEIFQNYVKDEQILSYPLNTQLCENFGKLNQTQFDGLKLNTTYCLKDNFSLEGIQGTEGSSWISIRIRKCSGQTCADLNGILNYVKGLQFEFYYIVEKLYLDSFDDQVVRFTLEQKYFDNVPSFSKFVDCDLGYDQLESYESFFPDFLNSEHKSYKALVVRKFNTEINDLLNGVFFEMNIFSSRIKILYLRRFNDVMVQISKIGGLISIIFSIGFLFSCLFIRFELAETMMNDFYYVIDPRNDRNYKKSFETFVKDHYNYLMKLYCLKNNLIEKKFQKEEKEDPTGFDKNRVEILNFNIRMSRKSYHSLIMPEKKLSANLETESKIYELEEIKEAGDNLEDDEGLLEFFDGENNKENRYNKRNLLYKFFTLRRIESMYNITTSQRQELINDLKLNNPNINIDEVNFYSQMCKDRKETKLFYANKMFYESLKYLGFNKMTFSKLEMLKIIFCLCCYKKKKNPNINEKISLQNKNEIYEASLHKLGIDFDLISVLKSVKDLKNFMRIFFDKNQKKILNSINKNTIMISNKEYENFLKDSYNQIGGKSENNEEISIGEFYNLLLNILERGVVSPLEKKMFKIIGMNSENIKEFCKAAGAKLDSKLENQLETEIPKEKAKNKMSEKNSINNVEIENEIIDMVIKNNLK